MFPLRVVRPSDISHARDIRPVEQSPFLAVTNERGEICRITTSTVQQAEFIRVYNEMLQGSSRVVPISESQAAQWCEDYGEPGAESILRLMIDSAFQCQRDILREEFGREPSTDTGPRKRSCTARRGNGGAR